MGFGQCSKIARIRFDVPRDLTSAPEGYRAPTKKRGSRWSPVEGLRRGAKERFERTVSFGESAREMIPDLLHFKPDVIWSNPSHARQLADVIAEDGIKGIRPKFVVLGGEILDEPTRAYLESTFGANAYPIFGAVELGSIARSCTERAGMHLMADSLLVEVLRDGEPVSPGEPGEMVVTNLLNEAMPLIRYKIGDVVIASGDPCQCGVTLPMLKSVEGRSVDYILLSNGESLSPRRILTFLHSVNDLPRTRRHQFLQRSLDRFELQIIGEEEPEARVQADGVAARLRPLLGKNATIEGSFEDIRRRTVKFRPVVSLPSRQRLGKGVTLDKASSD